MKGCLGMAVVFSVDSPVCDECEYRRQCADMVNQSLLTIHEQTDVTDYLQAMTRLGYDNNIEPSPNVLPRAHKERLKVKKKQITSLKLELIADMTKGAKRLATSMLKAESEVESAIQERRNPYVGVKPSYIAPAFELVLTNNLNKDSLIRCLCSHNSNWSKDTIRSHYHTIINAFVGLGIVERSGTKFKTRGMANANN